MMALNVTTVPISTEIAFERKLTAIAQAAEDHQAYLLHYLFRLTRQWQDAENLLQDLWRHVLLNFDEDKVGALPLLRRKAYQLFVDHYRKTRRRGEVPSDAIPDLPAEGRQSAAFTDESETAFKERFWEGYPGIELTEPQKEALWLHARYGFTFKELEARLGIPASTVGDWITLARKRLSDVINNEPK